MNIITRKSPRLITAALARWLPLFESAGGPLLGVRKFLLLFEDIGKIISLARLRPGEWGFNGDQMAQEFTDSSGHAFVFSANRRGELMFQIWLATFRVDFTLSSCVASVWQVSIVPLSRERVAREAFAFASKHKLSVSSVTNIGDRGVNALIGKIVAGLPKRTVAKRTNQTKKRP